MATLEARWKLDEAPAVAVDSAGGTSWAYGAGVTGSLSPLLSDGGTCVHGSGSALIASRPSVASGLSGANVTAEVWVNLPGTNVQGTFVKVGNSTTGWGFGIGGTQLDNAGQKLILLAENVAWVPTTYTFPSAGTYHVVVVRGSGTATVYVNGSSVWTGSFSPNTASSEMAVGGRSGALILSSSVKVDNVAIFPSALSSTRVTAHYNSGSGDNSALSADSPTVWLKLDESTVTPPTTFADSSGNSRPATITGAVTLGGSAAAVGIPGNSASFVTLGGVHQYGVVSSPSWFNSVGALSIKAWFKTSASGSRQAIVAQDNTFSSPGASDRKFALYLETNGKLHFIAFTSAGGFPFAETTGTYNDGAWHQVVATRSTTTLTIYVDGTSVATQSVGGTLSGSGVNLTIGDVASLNNQFTGSLDDVAVYSGELTSTEVATLYSTETTLGGTPVSLTGVTANVAVAAPAGTVAAGTTVPVSLTGVTANVTVAAPVGTVSANTAIPVSLTGVVANVTVAAPAGTVTAGSVGAVALTGVTIDITVAAPAGTVATTEDVEWEELESYTQAWATAAETITVTVDPVTLRPGYSLKVVDMHGDVLCDLTEASIGTATRALNGRGGLDFSLPKLSAEIAMVQQFSEVQLWRGGHLVPGGWFVVVDPGIDIDAHAVGFQCSGLSYYFERRLIGGDRTELLLNGGFESGARYWNFGWTPGGTSGRPPDHTITRDACEGGKALRIYGDSNGHRQYGWESHDVTNTHPTEPLWIDIQAQYRIDDWDGPSKDGWSLYADVRNPSDLSKILYNESVSVDETTPRDRWLPQSVRVKVAANTTSRVTVRLYPPHGSASFDQVSIKADTALIFTKRDPWQVIEGLVTEAQNVTNGKSDLNIGSWGSWSGFKIDRPYPWKDRVKVSEAIDEVVRSRNGPDANMEVGARIRRLTVAPKQGVLYRKPVFALGDRVGDARIVSYSAGIDGDEVTTRAVVQSSWSSGGMSEVIVTSDRDDGLVLETLYQTEQDSPTSTLLEQGRTAVKYGRADVITRVVMHPEDTTTLLPPRGVTIGSVVTLDVHDGEIDVRADYRIVQIDLDPDHDQLSFAVVPEV